MAIALAGGGLAVGGLMAALLPDRFKMAADNWYGLVLTPLLFVICASIAIKQLRYYYGGPGAKDGLFVNAIRQASNQEFTADLGIAFSGGLLTALVFLPTMWWTAFMLFSVLVAWRSNAALKRLWINDGLIAERPEYAFTRDVIAGEYKNPRSDPAEPPINVSRVLGGWILSHGLYCGYGLLGLVGVTAFSSFASWVGFAFALMLSVGILPLYMVWMRAFSYEKSAPLVKSLQQSKGIATLVRTWPRRNRKHR